MSTSENKTNNSQKHKKYGFACTPKCELCKTKDAITFSWIDGEWTFTCSCAADKETYFVYMDDFFASPTSAVACLAELHREPTMNWQRFASMMQRFQKAINGITQFTEVDVGDLSVLMDDNAKRMLGLNDDTP